jgi:hypothetical protein
VKYFFLTCSISIKYSLYSKILDKQGKRQMTILPLMKTIFCFLSSLPPLWSLPSMIFNCSKASPVPVPQSWAISRSRPWIQNCRKPRNCSLGRFACGRPPRHAGCSLGRFAAQHCVRFKNVFSKLVK